MPVHFIPIRTGTYSLEQCTYHSALRVISVISSWYNLSKCSYHWFWHRNTQFVLEIKVLLYYASWIIHWSTNFVTRTSSVFTEDIGEWTFTWCKLVLIVSLSFSPADVPMVPDTGSLSSHPLPWLILWISFNRLFRFFRWPFYIYSRYCGTLFTSWDVHGFHCSHNETVIPYLIIPDNLMIAWMWLMVFRWSILIQKWELLICLEKLLIA